MIQKPALQINGVRKLVIEAAAISQLCLDRTEVDRARSPEIRHYPGPPRKFIAFECFLEFLRGSGRSERRRRAAGKRVQLSRSDLSDSSIHSSAFNLCRRI